jgi:hypothetical protein
MGLRVLVLQHLHLIKTQTFSQSSLREVVEHYDRMIELKMLKFLKYFDNKLIEYVQEKVLFWYSVLLPVSFVDLLND